MPSVFGKEFEQDWPLKEFNWNLTKYGQKLLNKCLEVEKPPAKEIDRNEFIEKSHEFPIEFPIDSCRVKSQPVERWPIIQQQIVSAYPLIHEKVLFLIIDFLEYKLKYGTSLERKLYKNMSICDFVQRLLTKRCISFLGNDDDYLLITGATGFGPKYLKVGTKEERSPLMLNDVLSYDEIKISALLSISSYSDFINDGNRANSGKVEKDLDKIERAGVVISLIGARFERKELMEFQDITITQNQNTLDKGYGCTLEKPAPQTPSSMWQRLNPRKKIDKLEKLQNYRYFWNKFYEERDHLHDQVVKDGLRFGDSLNCLVIFDNLMMKKRYAISLDLLLLEANKRATEKEKLAYIHVIGFGLGVWRAASQQEQIFFECFEQRLKYLMPQLSHIGVVHFSWFNLHEWGQLQHKAVIESAGHLKGGVRILISKRNPSEKLSAEYDDMLLIVSYAGDGNALPGNEFWLRGLKASNDPSTACSTLITELHNAHINTDYINGNNLHIASGALGIVHIQEYVKELLNDKSQSQQ